MASNKAAEARQERLAQEIRDYQAGTPVVLTRTQIEEMDDTAGLRVLRADGFKLFDMGQATGRDMVAAGSHLGALA